MPLRVRCRGRHRPKQASPSQELARVQEAVIHIKPDEYVVALYNPFRTATKVLEQGGLYVERASPP